MNSVAIAPAYIHTSVKRRKNVWYSVKSGNWTDPAVWQSNATKRWSYPGQNIPSPIFPQEGDDVYINAFHTVTINITSFTNIVVHSAYVAGTLAWDNSNFRTFSVLGDLQVTGTLNMTTTNQNFMYLYGVNNFVTTFVAGTTSNITYIRNGDQPVMDLAYYNLDVRGTGTKYASANLVTNGILSTASGSMLELLTYNLTSNGTTSVLSGSTLSKTGAGTVLFVGAATFSASSLLFSGNPTVEIRAGLTYANGGSFNSGTTSWTFTTNNQTFSTNQSPVFDCPIYIANGITLTILETFYRSPIYLNDVINGLGASSNLINKGSLFFNNTTSLGSLTTGTFDFSTYQNTIGFVGNYTTTIPAAWNNLWELYIAGTGTKSLGANTTLADLLYINSTVSTLDLSSYNLTVNGVSTIQGLLTKSGAGNILFVGKLTTVNGGYFVFNSGNPTVELRNGWDSSVFDSAFKTGTGVWSFSTNNQSIKNTFGGNSFTGNTFDAPILISGAITLTLNMVTSSATDIAFVGGINGNNAGSTLDNRFSAGMSAYYQNANAPMLTGVLTTNAAANIFKYNKAGNQDVKGGTYRTIEFGGSGNKTLQGNVVIDVTNGGGQSTTGTAVVVLNGFTITTI